MDETQDSGAIDRVRETIAVGPRGPASQATAEAIILEIQESCRQHLGCGRGSGPHMDASADRLQVRSSDDDFSGQLQVQIANNMTYAQGGQQEFLSVSAKVELSSKRVAQAAKNAAAMTWVCYGVGIVAGVGLGTAIGYGFDMAAGNEEEVGNYLIIAKWPLLIGIAFGVGLGNMVGRYLKERARAKALADPAVRNRLRRWEALVKDIRGAKKRKRAVMSG